MGSYGKSFRGLIISRICEKFSGDGVAENYGTVGKFHENINFLSKIVSYRITRKVVFSSDESAIGSRVMDAAR